MAIAASSRGLRHGGTAASDRFSESALSALNISTTTSTLIAMVLGRRSANTAQAKACVRVASSHACERARAAHVMRGPAGARRNHHANAVTVTTPTYAPMSRYLRMRRTVGKAVEAVEHAPRST